MANIFEMIGSRNNIRKLTVLNDHTSFVNRGINSSYYSDTRGVDIDKVKSFVTYMYSQYSSSFTVYEVNASYASIKTQIDSARPFLINVGNNLYGQGTYHSVACYAYNRMVSTTTGYYLSFAKIADGINNSGRYLLVSSIQSCKMYYTVVNAW